MLIEELDVIVSIIFSSSSSVSFLPSNAMAISASLKNFADSLNFSPTALSKASNSKFGSSIINSPKLFALITTGCFILPPS